MALDATLVDALVISAVPATRRAAKVESGALVLPMSFVGR